MIYYSFILILRLCCISVHSLDPVHNKVGDAVLSFDRDVIDHSTGHPSTNSIFLESLNKGISYNDKIHGGIGDLGSGVHLQHTSDPNDGKDNEKPKDSKDIEDKNEQKIKPILKNDDTGPIKPPIFNNSRWCKADVCLVSVPELLLFNALSVLFLLFLVIWHLGLLLRNKGKYEGYTDLSTVRSNTPTNDRRTLLQEGYSYTLPGWILLRYIILYTAICQVFVLSFVCNELCIPMIDGVKHWDMRAKPFFISWLIGFLTLLLSFLFKNTKVGKYLFLARSPLHSCEIVLISDFSKSSASTTVDHDILSLSLHWISTFASYLKLMLNISDNILKVPFEKYKASVKHYYIDVKSNDTERYFFYHYVKYTYSHDSAYFVDAYCKVSNYLKNTNLIDLLDRGGLTELESMKRTEDVGKNVISVEKLPFSTLLHREISDPIFFMQLYLTLKSIYWRSCITAPIWGFTSLYTIYKKVKIIHDQQNDIAELATSSANRLVTVLRENVTRVVPATDLAVGDIVRVDSDWEAPSDMIMLRGDAIVDESSVTGESIPLRKTKLAVDKYNYSLSIFDLNIDLDNDDMVNSKSADEGLNDHLLKAGTRVVAVLGNDETVGSAVAVVIATGAFTTKGKQLKGVLFPNQFRLKYDTQLPTVFILTFIYAIICSYYQIQFLGWNMTSIFYSIGTLSQVVPVWTSTIISISQSRACQRLSKSESVYCIAPSRIAVCGKVRVMCFDKTGTLTNNSLIFNGSRFVVSRGNTPIMSPDEISPTLDTIKSTKNMATNKDESTIRQIVSLAISTCHSLWPSNTNEQFGNHVDKSMFSSTGCTVEQFIDEGGATRRFIRNFSNKDLVMEVLRTFDFDYRKKLSSVVVAVTVESEEPLIFAFVKGAFENVSNCCMGGNSDLGFVANAESSNGSYVLGLAYKIIENENIDERDEVENNLKIGGLLLFNNEVRPESLDIIQSLHEAKVRPVILTGDNIAASQYVARTCGMFTLQSQAGPIAKLEGGDIVWLYPHHVVDEERLFFTDDYHDLSLTGDAFDHIQTNWGNILKKNGRLTSNQTANDNLFEQFLLRVRIFARLNPHQKVRVINAFKSLEIITGMCGDGTNDCLALQASHAGISLTSGATSMVSPFSSKNNKLESVISLIREGRGSLVTSLACFKFMLLFGLMIAFVKVTLFRECRGVMPEWGYLLLENAILLSLSYTMAMSRPSDKLRIRSPTSSLLGPLTLFSVGIMFFINIFFLSLIFKLYNYLGVPSSLDFNRKMNKAAWWILSDNFESPTICLWLCYQVVNTALVFSFGGVFREPILRNHSFTA
ncbi:p-type ATPase family member protein [Theileria equi strain WA]|uniref:P-type ATPase family member protein n=1 Tax=Theileria equi strain WA TaxID=1537102 RepID=L1LFC7_THEEQ|nr:p-type ATPase family member protein [Theileria equi strain WA]EKX74061.1 p-type ATPase family member protein [Theileria equi strain WA]|eukprot:XP_004833513.1 p-type ATPase family member protein [Theileria equi strain WA]